MKEDIRVLLVDDHQVVREGLRHMLRQEEDMEVIGEAANAKEALTQVHLLSPDVILMDIKMPGVDGIELTLQLKEKQPSCNVIMLTLYDEYLAEAIEAGAGGYLLKDTKRTELAQAIRRVHRGEVVISENITSKPRDEYEKRVGEKGEERLLQEDDGSSAMLEEVQLVVHSPADAAQLIGFVGRVEEMLQSHMLKMVGSWKGDTAITIPLPEPTLLADILNKLGMMAEVEATREEPLTGEGNPSLSKQAAATPTSKTKLSRTISVTLT